MECGEYLRIDSIIRYCPDQALEVEILVDSDFDITDLLKISLSEERIECEDDDDDIHYKIECDFCDTRRWLNEFIYHLLFLLGFLVIQLGLFDLGEILVENQA